MRKSRLAAIAAAVIGFAALVFVPSRASAQAINFEDLPAGTAVKAQYGSRGVIFPGDAHIATDPHAHSGTRVLRSISETAEVFTIFPMVMTFTSPQKRVAFFAGNFPGGTGRGTLKAFGANNAVLAQDGPKAVPANAFTAFFQVQTPQASIVRAEFQIEGGALELIDDLVVEGTTTTPPPNPPVVGFTSPTEGAVMNEGTVPFRGTVTGPSLLDTVTLRVTRGLPGDSTAPPANNVVNLSGTGNTRTFSLDYGALTGPYTLTAIATNTANLQGTRTVHFTILPDAIRARFDSSGGAGTFGTFRFGAAGEAGCVVAVYDKGLIAAVNNQTFIVTGAIFQKWMATREQGQPLSKLGCPTAEERDALGATRAQDFRHGRIYNKAGTTAYVPEVFRDAIETLGGEETTGVAVTDPTDSTGAMQTWLFQRFARLDHPGIEPSTLEIRGSQPWTLFVERVGEAIETSGAPMYPRTATVYRTFPCDGNLGPCHVEKPTSPPSITHADALTRCPGTYDAINHTKEWQWLSGGDHGQTPLRGWVNSSRLSCTDNPLTHDYTMTNNGSNCKITDVFPSDWQVYIRPLAPFGNMTTEDQTYLEMEFEAYYAEYFFAGWGWPIAGDLIFTNGRWIMDCAHEPYKAEIHPPYLWSAMSTRKRTDGSLETVAEIWVNGYFPGDPVDVEIWPPPRPSPDAFLTVTRPVDSGSALGITVGLTSTFAGAKARFSAPHREVGVEGSGKMNWETGRGYEGEWTVYWSVH